MERTTYFMIRIRRIEDAPDPTMTGVLEQIDNGRKRAFASCTELLGLLLEFSSPHAPPRYGSADRPE